MNTSAFKQNTEIRLKNYRYNIITIIIKAGNSSTTKHRKERLNMNAMLITKLVSTIMQVRKSCVSAIPEIFFFYDHLFAVCY